MHEDLIQSALDSALRRAGADGGAAAVRACVIALGELTGLTPEAFTMEWQMLARGTRFEHAQIQIHIRPAELQCMACFQKYHPGTQRTLCPHCGSVGAKVLGGEECRVESIQFESQ
ncbi:MAG TPA: hydrogenase maturation nickel metallochaperone HypA [Anaerolineales bacterium]|jgi:hydrogenase nickel insertion protein HypA